MRREQATRAQQAPAEACAACRQRDAQQGGQQQGGHRGQGRFVEPVEWREHALRHDQRGGPQARHRQRQQPRGVPAPAPLARIGPGEPRAPAEGEGQAQRDSQRQQPVEDIHHAGNPGAESMTRSTIGRLSNPAYQSNPKDFAPGLKAIVSLMQRRSPPVVSSRFPYRESAGTRQTS
ncbi:hypothetical protein BGLA2_2160001 [Burkholderia gladioli]|nr:hypothetical protein BGLA2_2160001 [Burkholderia gladioli]